MQRVLTAQEVGLGIHGLQHNYALTRLHLIRRESEKERERVTSEGRDGTFQGPFPVWLRCTERDQSRTKAN